MWYDLKMLANLAYCGRRRFARWAVSLTVVAGMLATAGLGHARGLYPKPTDRVASAELLVRTFERFVLGDESTEKRVEKINKWIGPIRAGLYGVYAEEPYWLAILNVMEVYTVSDLEFRYVETSEETADLAIIFGTHEELVRIVQGLGARFAAVADNLEGVSGFDCGGGFGTVDGVIIRGVVLFPIDLDQRMAESCSFESLMQALGFLNYSYSIRPSIQGEEDEVAGFSIDDQILIRTLYDERIKPGMPRGEALERAREIIAEDVAAARAGGAIPAD